MQSHRIKYAVIVLQWNTLIYTAMSNKREIKHRDG